MANTKLRVGAVNYLNTKPLVFGLAADAPNIALSFDLPSRLADDLAAGELDVALIPSVEFFRQRGAGYHIVSDACIACRGPVWSVKLFSRVPLAQVKTLAQDEGSRTSAAMVQILLHEQFGIRPQLTTLPIGASLADTSDDAVLLIGDRAIHPPTGKFAEVWDLGEQWRTWTGLPFVFAMWVARDGVDTTELADVLSVARDRGLANLEQIAAREAAAIGLTTSECLAYLHDNLHFTLGSQEQLGLTRFERQAAALDLIPTAAAEVSR